MALPDDPDERRRLLAAVFGDVLPDTTADERPAGGGADPDREADLLADRPPHHDRD
jgi:hypothetical protein